MMPLDPQVQKLLEWAARSSLPPYPQLGIGMARAAYEKASLVLEVPEVPMTQVTDHSVNLPGRTITIRDYAPTPIDRHHPAPALLYFHGGGFTIGSISTHDRLCRVLASGGQCRVFSVGYRLAPEYPFPAAPDDALASLEWLLAQASQLGVDASRIALGGDSAGGNLAAVTAIEARDRAIAIRLQMLLYPGVAPAPHSESHRRLEQGFLLDRPTIDWFYAQYLPQPAARNNWRFAPLLCPDLHSVAPAWIALAEFDPLVDEGLAYAERLRAVGVPVSCTVWPGMVHAFFQQGGFVPAVATAHAAAGAALRDALGHS